MKDEKTSVPEAHRGARSSRLHLTSNEIGEAISKMIDSGAIDIEAKGPLFTTDEVAKSLGIDLKNPPPKPVYETDFICVCKEEGQAEAHSIMSDVRTRLEMGSEELLPFKIGTKTSLLSAVVISLNWDYDAYIVGIYNDQWSAVSAQTYDGLFRTHVQCDDVEDGIARTWQIFADRKDASGE